MARRGGCIALLLPVRLPVLACCRGPRHPDASSPLAQARISTMAADAASDADLAVDYATARERFLAAAADAGARCDGHPLAGRAGPAPAVDVARIGDGQADRALLLVSGTGGIEGFAGSALQTAWLRRHRAALPGGCRVLLVHGLNAHGFQALRRVDADNVDLDRNFLDFVAPLPDNPGYEELAATLAPHEWDELGERINRRVWADFIARHGERAFLDGVSGGQYRHPDGIYYGGRTPALAHRLLRDLLRRELVDCHRLLLIDLRTGPGLVGEAELICRHSPDDAAFTRARDWFGPPLHSPQRGDTLAPVAAGTLLAAAGGWLPQAEVTAVALRFGTGPEDKMFAAVRADNWLMHHGDPTTPRGLAIKAQLRDAFAPDSADWRRAVLDRGDAVIERGLRGLVAG